MEEVDITIIGAGVIGLAIAVRLSRHKADIFVIEKERSFGQGISSRNSEVIHAGIYYPTDSLKAKTCVEGNRMLYELCAAHSIAHKKLGKLIVATCDQEARQLQELCALATQNGVSGIKIIDAAAVKKLEPHIKAQCALYSPETGIIDTHAAMNYFHTAAKQNGVGFVYQSPVKRIEKKNGSYHISITDTTGDTTGFQSRSVINAAGLSSDTIAELCGLDTQQLGYDLHYCKGQYFRLPSHKSRSIQRLVYPVPYQSDGGLGIHLTPDLSGQVRVGPDAEYLIKRHEDYRVDTTKQRYFFESVRQFAPFVEENDMSPDTAGIRPKLQGPDDGFRDFIIREESGHGFPGLINLIGIESPGLTAALPIARIVENLLQMSGK